MKKTENTVKGWRKWLLAGRFPFMAVTLVTAVWGGYAAYVADNGIPVVIEDGSWSSVVLGDIHEGLVMASPLPVANACGLGASSCYKCHNGKRAAAPAEQPWHTQHTKVSHSCSGCHKGNERLMLKGLSHKNMIIDSRTDPDQACAGCHADGDMQSLLGQYQQAK